MSYDMQQWLNDSLTTPLNASRLGYMETGIRDAALIADQALAAATTVNSGIPGAVYFDTFFSGSTDDAKFTNMNNWAAAASGPTPVVFFTNRQYNHSTPIKLFSGLKLAGTAGFAAREFSRGTIFNWQGASGTSQLIYPPEGQTGQSYPADGSPRDITMTGIQFQGGGSTHWMPKLSPGQFTGTTLWYCQFHNCGWKNFNTVWWGAGTGTSISGTTHMQGMTSTALYVGGSECSIFGDDAYSFVDSSQNPTAGTPFLRSSLAKSFIGRVMITSRQTNYCISVEGGHNLTIKGLAIDAQSSDPIYGAGIKISGGDGVVLDNVSHKGVATNPASGSGGASANRAWIQVTGGRQITIQNNNFRREGNNLPATSYPLMYVSSGANEVKWGFNNYSNFGGSPAVIQQAVANKITNITDPSLTVTTAA